MVYELELQDWYGALCFMYNFDIVVRNTLDGNIVWRVDKFTPVIPDKSKVKIELTEAGHYMIKIMPFVIADNNERIYLGQYFKEFPVSVNRFEINKFTSESVSDVLHSSYVEDFVKGSLLAIYETQALKTRAYIFIDDPTNTRNELSLSDIVIDYNNVLEELRPSTTRYEIKELKILWKTPQVRQTKIQKKAEVQVFYIEGIAANNIVLKSGDILKDPVDAQSFFIITKVEEQYTIHPKFTIKSDPAYRKIPKRLYTLYLSRLNLNTLPEFIKKNENIYI